MFTYIRAALIAIAIMAWIPAAAAATITVEEFSGDAIQAAIDRAEPGDVIFLPAGVYPTTGQILIDKPITLRGAARLENVAVPEWDGQPTYPPLLEGDWPSASRPRLPVLENDPPRWDGTPSELVYADAHDYDMMRVTADDVRIERILFRGAVNETMDNMATRQNGIFVMAAGFFMDNCEMTRFPQALTADVPQAQMKVRRSYFHENWARGSSYGVRATGGARVDVRYSEFSNQRHDVVGNSRDTLMVIVDNYFVNNTRELGAYSLDMHPNGYESPRMIIRNNIFRNTSGIVFMSGSGEVTGNYFDQWVRKWNPTLLVKSGFRLPQQLNSALPHTIYIGRNANKTGEPLLTVGTAQYDGVRKWAAYNVYDDGVLWEAANTQHPPRDASPRPLLGHVYLTEPGRDEPLRTIERGRWYDLHAKAVDPQGADDIAEIGLQVRRDATHAYAAGNEGGVFDPAGNYFIRTDGDSVWIRAAAGEGDWHEASAAPDAYVDIGPGGRFQFTPAGSHRIHFVVRFRLGSDAMAGRWQLNGYARDRAGNHPFAKAYLDQVGWRFEVARP